MKAVRYAKLSRRICRVLTTTSCYSQSMITPEKIVKSPLPSISIPNQSIEEFLFDRIDRWADKTAVVCANTGRSFTYAEYHKMTERVAQALCVKLGFKKSDVIAVLLPNVPEYVTIFTAAFRCGIILTTINPVYTADEIAHQMKNCSAKALITLAENHNTARTAIRKLQTNTNIPIITVKRKQSESVPEGTINFQELCEYNGPTIKLQSPAPEEIALLPYSSGTTGLPKGVELNHRNIVSNLVQLTQDLVKLNEDTTKDHQDVIPIIAPMYHAYGSTAILFKIFSQGCKGVVMSEYRPDLYLNMLEKYSPHLLHVVPPIVMMLINNKNANRNHFKRLRHMVSASAPIAYTDIDRFKEKFAQQIKVSQYYGLTETTAISHAHCLDRELSPGSVGWNLSSVEARIVSVDDETKNLGPNQSGHLLIRGPQVMPGYHKNPKATAEAFDEDGWFKSGDIGHYQEDGSFFITDRIKELIKVKGFPVAPAELEALIRQHPDVHDVAVIGIPHDQNGEAPRAFVVPRPGTNLKLESVVKYVEEKAAKYKHLTGGVVFVNEIPKNPTGKILRRKLKDPNYI